MTMNATNSASATAGKSSVQTRFEGSALLAPRRTAGGDHHGSHALDMDDRSGALERRVQLDYMGFSTYRTGFRALEGSLEFDATRPDASSVTASIPVASVDVTNDRLMSRLMDPDLLGGKEHPTITFESTRLEAVD